MDDLNYIQRCELEKMKETHRVSVICAWTLSGILLLIAGLLWLVPLYRVWSSELKGKAEYVRAEQNRRIKIEEAKANLEAEKLNAQAEIERAKGAAEAIKIENGSITPTYIQYLWVRQQNASSNNRLIYIPTEAGLPILEAGRKEQTVN